MASTEPVTLDFLAKELKALRKDIRKIRQHLPTLRARRLLSVPRITA
jgi:hypothetical protein